MRRTPGRPKKIDALVPISGRVPPDLKHTIVTMKKAEGSSVAEVVRRLLEQGLAVDGVLQRRAANTV